MIDTTADPIGNAIAEELLRRGEHAVEFELIDTSGMHISHCVGCNYCWLHFPAFCGTILDTKKWECENTPMNDMGLLSSLGEAWASALQTLYKESPVTEYTENTGDFFSVKEVFALTFAVASASLPDASIRTA